MKFNALFLGIALVVFTWPNHAYGQDNQAAWRAAGRVFDVMAYSYAGYNGSVDFWATNRLPDAKGEITISRESELAAVDAEIEDVPPASAFGLAYNMYTLWLISPEGELQNAGSFNFHGDKGHVHAETAWPTFGVFVTAELDCNVHAPSQIVIFVNASSYHGPARYGSVIIPYACTPRPGNPQVSCQAP
jgi:hypothetical protein